MNKHDPLNRKCLQNCVVNRGARVSCAHLHHDCTCPAQKEDPFSEFMKSQGINVVDVTPTQKEEKATASTKILKGLQLHRNDCPVRFVNCICKFGADEILDEVKNMVNGDAQKEEWEEEFDRVISLSPTIHDDADIHNVEIKDFIRATLQSTRADERKKIVEVVKGMQEITKMNHNGCYPKMCGEKTLEDVLAKISQVWHLNRH